MKATRKILAAILAIILLVSMIPMVSNAATITINNNDQTPAAGRSYTAYEILKLNTDGTYSFAPGMEGFITEANAETYGIDFAKDSATMKAAKFAETIESYNADQTIALANLLYAYVKDNAQVTKTTTTAGDTSNVIENVEKGYYLVTDNGNISPLSRNILIPVTTDSASINVKAETIPFEKTTSNPVAGVGETVPFTITSKVPDLTGYNKDSYNFVITDTMTNLTYVEGSLKVTIGGTEVTVAPTIANKVLTVDLSANVRTATAGADIVVTYSATVDANAVVETAKNSAKLEYTNNPNTNGTGEKETPEVVVDNYEISLKKVNAIGTKLDGAEFYLKNAEGKYLTVSNENGVYKVTGIVTTKAEASKVVAGEVTIKGLGDNTYTLEEVTAPTGYKTAEGLVFKVVVNTETTDEVTTKTATVNKVENASSEYIKTSGTTVTVVNVKNTTLLPSTGGVGTTIFTVVGIALMVAAVVALVVINKKNNK